MALWEANLRFDLSKAPEGIAPIYVFTRFAQQTVRGRIADYLKKLAGCRNGEYLPSTLPETPAEVTGNPVDHWDDDVRRCMSTLAPRERSYVTEGILHDRSIADIARLYGVSTHAVRAWRRSALHKLQAFFRKA